MSFAEIPRESTEPVTEYVGCPWQTRNPDEQIYLCYAYVYLQANDVTCKGPGCLQFVTHHRLRKMLHEQYEKIRALEEQLRGTKKMASSPGSQVRAEDKEEVKTESRN